MIGNTVIEAVHEGCHGRNVDAAKGADDTCLGHARRNITGHEGCLVGCVDLTKNVRNGRVVSHVDDRIFRVRIGAGRSGRCISHQEADGNDDVAFGVKQCVEVRFVVRFGL